MKLKSLLKSHMFLMAVGCIAMAAAFLLVPLSGINPGKYGYLLLFLICPAMHLFMMKGMHGHKHNEVETKVKKIKLLDIDKQGGTN